MHLAEIPLDNKSCCLFNIRNKYFSSSIKDSVAYANEANI